MTSLSKPQPERGGLSGVKRQRCSKRWTTGAISMKISSAQSPKASCRSAMRAAAMVKIAGSSGGPRTEPTEKRLITRGEHCAKSGNGRRDNGQFLKMF